MSDAQQVVESFDCNYNIGTAVRCLLEHTQGVDRGVKAHPTLYLGLRHLVLELRRLEPRWVPDAKARSSVSDMGDELDAFVKELQSLPVNEQVMAIKGLLISTIRTTLEDLTRAE